MRKMLLSALACVAFVGSAFASSEVEIQNSKEDKVEQTTPCRWREVITINGKKYYGPWTSGNCNTTVHEDGTVVYHPIKTLVLSPN